MHELIFIHIYWVLSILLHYSTLLAHSQSPTCSKYTSCQECIVSSYQCGWCPLVDFNQSSASSSTRCIPITEANTCIDPHTGLSVLESPISALEILTDNQLGETVNGQTVLTQPQRVRLKLRPGETLSFNITSSPARGYPLDLYLLIDVSSSMEEAFVTIKNNALNLRNTVQNITSDFRLGLGSFVDKPISPYRDESYGLIDNPCAPFKTCDPTHSFYHSLNLTDNFTLFQDALFSQRFSRNVDNPEGTLDALLQATVCTDFIGWRNNSRHLVLVFTDGTFHIANDGKLAGIINQNDGTCHLNYQPENPNVASYTKAIEQDYPSVGQLSAKLQFHDIFTVFAIGSNQDHHYQLLANQIGRSWVAKLQDDASNVLSILTSAYSSLSEKVVLEIQQVAGLDIRATPFCAEKSEDGLSCVNINLGDRATFQIDVKLNECLTSNLISQIKVLLYGQVELEVVSLCSCPCDGNKISNAEECTQGNGTLICGICNCNPGRFGTKCGCSGKGAGDVAACQTGNSTRVCSGRGSCLCGKCECNQRPNDRIYGEFCECDTTSCENDRIGRLCGGEERGDCDCGNCKCKVHSGTNLPYTGTACECSPDPTPCIPPAGTEVCNGRGECTCGSCQCRTSEYIGTYCEICLGENNKCYVSDCSDLQSCAECVYLNLNENYTDACAIACSETEHSPEFTENQLDTIENSTAQACRGRAGTCNIFYYVARSSQAKLLPVFINTNGICDTVFPFYAIIIAILVLGVILSIIIIIIIKLIFYYLELREYKEFEKEVQSAIATKFVEAPKDFHKPVVQETSNPIFGLQNKNPLETSGSFLSSYQPGGSGSRYLDLKNAI